GWANHPVAHIHGDTALLQKNTNKPIVLQKILNALLANNIMTEDLYIQLTHRVPGYGLITNIFNGGLECGHGFDNRVVDRIGFYKRYCDLLE
ncbi:26 kda endochitinase 1, partial [Quercus suber]